ncbi:molybdopterin-dependent oxidoreductase [Novosphingobium sp. TH158]|uniref:molybdopterin-containing oxidoreductase family protein n=1 Tax=Novosphingobium sp. TH158 TaxID=2067455 RepID=UPI000C7A1A39|nr:molybdopterin-dependent oxidoreductase [Novosphingobium sp. TH158]PLK27481.1 molybdopterin oxidoreductase [Novosphingobium sp. TH158]
MTSSPEQIRGACGHDCPDTCAWVVTVEQGRATALAGDRNHPFTRGTLCAKVNHYLDRVYHPDRVLHPLRRTGPKGSGQFERVSWDEALADIAGRWQAIIAEYGAEAILPYSSAGMQGLVQQASLDMRLFGALGASRLDRNICGAVASAGMKATLGVGSGIDPEEVAHARLIVLWGTNTVITNLHYWPLVKAAQKNGATLVVIDPVRTRTAEEADWHIQLLPGSDAALAMAVMHVMHRDGLVDEDYVRAHALGYDQLVERLADHSPQAMAPIIGLPAEEIERFARLYATTHPSLLRPLIGIEHHINGAMQFRAVSCLPVLSGAFRHRGGGIARSTHALHFAALDMAAVERPDLWQPARTLNMRDLGRDLCDPALAPPVKALMVYGANPMVSIPNQALIAKGLAREDLFTVVHDMVMTDTARFADYVLPATSQIEHLDLAPAWGHLYLALNRPAISPPGEALCNTELFRRLATALGREEPWLHESDEAMIRAALASGHPWLQGITFEQLWEEGHARLAAPEDWRPFADGQFPTPSGKAELWSETLAAMGQDPLPGLGAIRREAGLQLITGKQLAVLNSGYGHIDRHRKRAGTLFVEVDPADAAARGLAEGMKVRVHNRLGEVHALCRISQRLRPGLAWMPFGHLEDASGLRRGVNVLTDEAETDWGGGSGLYDAFVEIEAVDAAHSPAGAAREMAPGAA